MHYFTSARARVERGVRASPTLFLRAHRIFQVSGGGSVPGFSRTGFPVRISAGRPPACPLCHPVFRQRWRLFQTVMGAAFPPENHPQSVKMAEVPPFFFSPLGRQVYGQWGPLSAVLEKATQNFFLPCFPNKILLSSCNCLFRETVSTIFCGLCNHTLYWPLFTISISKDLLKIHIPSYLDSTLWILDTQCLEYLYFTMIFYWSHEGFTGEPNALLCW